MTTLRACRTAFKAAVIAADSDAVLTGGVFDSQDLPDAPRITMTNAPKSGSALQPFAAIKWESVVPLSVPQRRAETLLVAVYYYQRRGYDVIDTVQRQVKDALYNIELGIPDYEGLAWVAWTGDVIEQNAPELLNASVSISRFRIDWTRR